MWKRSPILRPLFVVCLGALWVDCSAEDSAGAAGEADGDVSMEVAGDSGADSDRVADVESADDTNGGADLARDPSSDAGERDSAAPRDTDGPDTGEPDTRAIDGGPPPETTGCPPLPSSSEGRTVTIASGDVDGLVAAVNTAQQGDVLLLADGTYAMGGAYLWIDVADVTLRSQSGNREAVVLDGEYQTGEVVCIAASDVVVADLTIARAYNHAVHVVGADPNKGTVLYNLHVIDPGQQGIKINQTGTTYADYGLIACSQIEMTDAGRPEVRDNCYTGGIDAHRTRGWVVRDNTISGFWCPNGLSEHGIHFWQYNAETLIERNVVVNCARGIGLGLLGEGEGGRAFPDIDCPDDVFVEQFRGTIRNNVVLADDTRLFGSAAGFDNGISLASACQARVLHNTVYSTQPPFSSIEWRFPGTSVEVANNLISHNLRARTEDVAILGTNSEGATEADFVDVAGGDLHLAEGSSARNAGSLLPAGWCDQDIDGEARDAMPDLGVDERR